MSDEHAWPLPWYLRAYHRVGYFSKPPADLATWDIVIWDTQQGELPAVLLGERTVEYAGLRPGVLLIVSIAPGVWDATFPPLP